MLHLDQVQDHTESERWFSERKNILEPPEDLDAPPAEDKILLPYYLYGFILRSRKWAKFSIELINSIEDKNSFDDLVLQEGHSDAIKALVENHNRGPGRDNENGHVEISMDLVKGKGKGVIILLHGEPGVGKTSTAECIADYTSRPLYPITCGDIGETADTVEENLEKTFQLAHKWGCVLLLDEADVFLQERNREDLRRNAVVSVFLRVLEYYSGILFLTTNRVGIIDQAFRSRIHLSLFYPALDKNATLTIWKMHLNTAKRRFKERGQVLEVDKKEVLKFAKEQFKKMKSNNMNTWNGRQIRNAFQTAIALAEYHAQDKGEIHHQKKKGKKTTKLTIEEFKTVQQTSDSFDEYLRLTQLATQSTQARLNKTRRDDFNAMEQYAESRKVKSAAAKPKGRSEKKKVKMEPDLDSTTTFDSSEEEDEEEESSEDDGSQSGSDAASEQQKNDDSDKDVEEIPSKKAKGKKSISGKKGEDVAAKSEKIKTKKKESKKRAEDSDEEHETEAKVEKKRGKK
ncbi:Lon protease 4 [Lasiodiplodia hormozganensis]|uniref:Lon protease 4 n=1 Tax=Lasiodiplodia hormozganensis TaxID=869390 RepID=A0AA39YGP3_9PEZI|nr:Lon protease 4 [Lasiodiplodia hormozganensis]